MERKRARSDVVSEKEPVIHSLRPFMGALLWEYLLHNTPRFRLCRAILDKSGDLYDWVVTASGLPGGNAAAAMLSDPPYPSDAKVRRFMDDRRARGARPDFSHPPTILMYRIMMLQTEFSFPSIFGAVAKGKNWSSLADGFQYMRAHAGGVEHVFWKYVDAIFYPPSGARVRAVYDSIACYQTGKCAYEVDSFPLLLEGFGNMRYSITRVDSSRAHLKNQVTDLHAELVSYYKVRVKMLF